MKKELKDKFVKIIEEETYLDTSAGEMTNLEYLESNSDYEEIDEE